MSITFGIKHLLLGEKQLSLSLFTFFLISTDQPVLNPKNWLALRKNRQCFCSLVTLDKKLVGQKSTIHTFCNMDLIAMDLLHGLGHS